MSSSLVVIFITSLNFIRRHDQKYLCHNQVRHEGLCQLEGWTYGARGETTRDEYFDHPDAWIKISIDRLGGGRVVSDNVGNDRSAVIVNGRQGPDTAEMWRVKYDKLVVEEALLGRLYYGARAE